MEIRKKVVPYMVDQDCDKCNKGQMRPFQILFSEPPKWRHKCTNCECIEVYDKKYPTVEYEVLDEVVHFVFTSPLTKL